MMSAQYDDEDDTRPTEEEELEEADDSEDVGESDIGERE